MKIILLLGMLTLVCCQQKIQPQYSALVNYGYNYRTKQGAATHFMVDFNRSTVVIGGISYDLQFVGCKGRSCIWKNDLIMIRHYYQAGFIKVELEYEKEHVNADTKFVTYNVKQLSKPPFQNGLSEQ